MRGVLCTDMLKSKTTVIQLLYDCYDDDLLQRSVNLKAVKVTGAHFLYMVPHGN